MRRALKISCGAFAVLLALGVSLVGGLYIAGNTQSGRGMIEMLTSRLTSGHVKLSGLAGSFPKHLFIERLELRDERGTWLLAERVNLDWSPFAYIARGLQVNRLQVARLNMQRLPESSKPRDKAPVSIPRIDVGGISVDLLELGPQLTGAPASLEVMGSAHLRSVQDMAIEAVAHRIDGDGNYELHLRFDAKRMDAALTLHEPAGGPLENLLLLPGLGALAATVNLSGPRSAEQLDLAVEAGGLRARAQGIVNLMNLSGDLNVDVQSSASSPRPDLAWDSATLKGRWHGGLKAPTVNGYIDLAKLRLPGDIRMATLHADLSASLGTASMRATAGGLEIPGPEPRLLREAPVSIEATMRLDDLARPVTVEASHRLFSLHATAQTAGMSDGKQSARLELRLPNLTPIAAIAGQHVRGEALIKALVQGGSNSTRVTVDATAAVIPGTEIWSAAVGNRVTLQLGAELTDKALNLDNVKLNARALSLTGGGSASRATADAGNQSPAKLRGRWDLRVSDLSTLSTVLSGTMNASGSIEGPATSLAGEAHVTSLLSVRGAPGGALSADVKLQGLPSTPSGTIAVHGTFDGSPLDVDVAMQRGDARSWRALVHRAHWKSAQLDGDLSFAEATVQPTGQMNLQIAQLSDFQHVLGIDVGGSVTGSVRLRPDHQRTHAQIQLDSRSLALGKFAGDAQVSADGFTDALGVKVAVQVPNLQGSAAALTATGSLNLEAQAVDLQSLTVNYSGQEVRLLSPAKLAFADGVSVDALKLGAQKAVFQLSGKLAPTLDVHASLSGVQPALVNAFSPGLLESGSIEARAQLQGTFAAPVGEVRVSASGVRWGDDAAFGLQAFDVRANARLRGNTADVDARLIAGETSNLTVTGHAPLAAAGALDLKIDGDLDMAMINPLLEARGQHAAGRLAVDATVGGSVESPQIGGNLKLTKGSLRDYGRGVTVSNITAEVVGSHGTLQIKSFSAAAPPGTLTMTGTVGVLQKGVPVDIILKADNAEPVVSKLVTATLDANLRVMGTARERLDISGIVHFKHTLIGIPNSLPPNVAVLNVRRRGKKAAAAPGKPLVIGLDVTVQAPQEILVQGRGLDAEVGGELHLGGTSDSPVVSGELALRRGNFALASSRLNFTAGSVTFNGTGLQNQIDPNLDFTAQTSVGDVTAYLKISGPADAPQFEFTSNPPKQQEDIMALLLFGVPAANLSGLQLAQIGAALATVSGVGGGGGLNPLVKIQKSLGLDRLTVGSGTSNAAGTENTGASIEAGRYISRRVYVEAKQNTNGTSQLQTDVDLTKHLTLQTRLGNGTASVQGTTPENDPGSSIGLIYKFEY
ncbi:MAG: translocation/assembly module TamB domain-containing protein [Pseudomonadota bacterium]|nr:translocation/assembly module TamB domain-containing protein [Pseudomonadota bacterium]